MKKAGRLELQQDPFNVGQNLLVVTNAIALDDSVTDVPSHVISIRISGTWKELIEGGIGWFWDEAKNKFIPPQPFASWSLNASDVWEAPIAEPANTTFTHTEGVGEEAVSWEIDTYLMTWNETDQRWEGINREDNNNYYWNPSNSTWNLIT
jgi:hypothetical protein